MSMARSSSPWRPLATLARCCCVLLLMALLASPAQSAGDGRRPYLLVQHQVYEEHQEVLSKDPSRHIASEERKDDDELFDFVKDYLFKRGGAAKLRSRSSDGRAQFMGVNTGPRGSGEAAPGDGHSSGQRYKMHIVKFRLVNGTHPAVAGVKNKLRGTQEKTNATGVEKYAYKQGDYMPQEAQHREQHQANGTGQPDDKSTSLTRLWGSRSSAVYRTAHPTHVKATSRDPPVRAPADICELPAVTTTKRATTTTTRKTTTTTRKPTTTSTTTRKPTTTTCAPTTVRVIGCEQALPPSTTSSTTTTKTTTTSTTPKPYLHGHPYVVIKLHEVPGTRRVPVELINLGPPLQPLSPLRKHHPSNGTETERNASHHVSEHRSWFRGSSSSEAGDGQQRKVGEKHASRSRRIPEYEAETAALKREVAGNLMRVLRTIRELDSVAKGPQQEEEETEEKLEQAEGQDAMQPAQLEEQDPVRLVVPNPALDIDRLLRGRGNARGLKSAKRWTTQYPDELRENPAEEGDLHQFSILLKKALDELNAPPTTRTTTRPTTTKKKKLQTTTRPRKEFLGRR